MKTNIVMLAFASVVATTAADWAIGAGSASGRSETSRCGNETPGDEQSESLIYSQDKDRGEIAIEHGKLKKSSMPTS